MNPAGYRIEEKKLDAPLTPSSAYKSTHSSRSSVLERAREYNRRVEQKDAYEQPNYPTQQRRSKSLERRGSSHASGASASSNYSYGAASKRSHSVGRAVGISRTTATANGNQPATRERAMASVRREQEISNTKRSATRTNHKNAAAANKPAQQQQQPSSSARRSGPPQDPAPGQQQQQQQQQQQGDAAVTPELLVDALSGHEDGLLAIAEKLMEHYDQGYDVMGEAIIDAFADVQKLFQHVVEAAHMEGAAFEASRRDEELEQLRRQVASHDVTDTTSPTSGTKNSNGNNSGGPPRHDEFIDQDVKDVLTEAIRQGTALRDSSNHTSSSQQQQAQEQCCRIYERACQNASSLLPVDSDHRGRLQLSIARAESMSAERACAILRYAMDDVLRSGQRALMTQHTPLTEAQVRQRADVVLNRSHSSSHSPHGAPHSNHAVPGVVHQSSDEALASLREEMKEILSAPIYHDTPLQHVAQRFWKALQEADKVQKKNAERLEQNLGKLKGEFLLARAVRSLFIFCCVN